MPERLEASDFFGTVHKDVLFEKVLQNNGGTDLPDRAARKAASS